MKRNSGSSSASSPCRNELQGRCYGYSTGSRPVKQRGFRSRLRVELRRAVMRTSAALVAEVEVRGADRARRPLIMPASVHFRLL
jgi:hypothetical protein